MTTKIADTEAAIDRSQKVDDSEVEYSTVRDILEQWRSLMGAIRHPDTQSIFQSWQRDIQTFRESLAHNMDRVEKAIDEVRRVFGPLAQGFGMFMNAKGVLAEFGLLPHDTTPWHLYRAEDPEAFASAAINFYRDEWSEVEKRILKAASDYQISQNSKEAFADALRCHSHGLYRSAVLTLLPNVEREFREAFGKSTKEPSASLEELRIAVRTAPAGFVINHVAPIRLFEVFDQHLYQKVKTDDVAMQLSNDPIPNRHAAIHGIVDYSSELNSLNMIILADYVFFLINQLRVYTRQEQKREATDPSKMKGVHA